ncbi:tetratricopeptide repeat protein [Flavobacterium psychrophilum]|uniref:Tetratricopeptide repeat protein n=1 Tax=Flavobacterium psychrophilum TaxID=96345 RepID=A0A7U2NFY5_FLAPS|nr:tetratricopeptide repeat protein [Flavobacterium psychrophilum]EKT4545014.1 tetratricopeptide repeat protein [Flavobacterium psychrophilum]ELI6453936.1 tetratricopeptide repeat protein [Flavobacterium psychrophilum]ELY1979542.1 tetratricopeptide repeat protein [Flavobacterium psychrophilum]MBF2091848.1 tetratricopeptide repeat protein [Flavobacterium psychrophilum]MCB6088939.1 tetratricopeptide repeat protein [Flavobacterium psychrophilum]
MKNILFIFLLITQTFWAQTAFDKGNNLYQKGNYQEAITIYESVVKSGQQSAELYFNLGNCYYKLNKVAPAIFNFEKALLLNPNDSEIRNNLAFAQKMTIDEVVETPKVGFAKIIRDFTSSYHYDTWAWIAIVFSVLFLICFVGYYFSNTTMLKRIFFTSMLFILLFAMVSVFAGFFEKNQSNNDRPAIVFADITLVKSEPKSTAQDAFVLHAGTKVFVLESLNNYKKIQLLDLKEGWIEKSAIKELK